MKSRSKKTRYFDFSPKGDGNMEDNKVPYIVFESEMARHERTARRLVICLLISVALIFISNIAWLVFFNQFDYAIETTVQGTDVGNNSFVGEDGVINNGTSDSN